MALLPPPSRAMDVATRFGTVQVCEFASTRTPPALPAVLLPGRSSGVPMWASNLPDLAAKRTVYAVDALGDAGMSVQTREIENGPTRPTGCTGRSPGWAPRGCTWSGIPSADGWPPTTRCGTPSAWRR